jgi:hypothetical protein
LAAIAPAFHFHDVLLALSRLILAGGAALAMLFCFASNRAAFARAGQALSAKRKGLQLALEPLDGRGIAGYVPKP